MGVKPSFHGPASYVGEDQHVPHVPSPGPMSPPLLCDHVSLPLQRLLQTLVLQHQLVFGHVVLLPLLLQLALGRLQRLGQPGRTGRALASGGLGAAGARCSS